MQIVQAPMSRHHYEDGRAHPIRAIVIHATAGTYPGDLVWLRQGGSLEEPVSCHYLVNKVGEVFQMVRDEDTAWHAGVSSWPGLPNLNACSIGIELSNKNDGLDPYPSAQVAAAIDLCRLLVAKHHIERPNLVRHLDIAPGRKTDPKGLLWAPFVAAVYANAPASAPVFSADSPILGPQSIVVTDATIDLFTNAAGGHYDRASVQEILTAYARVCTSVGMDVLVPLAQMAHETGWLTSFWSQRPQRNPAGLGVTGDFLLTAPKDRRGWVFSEDRHRWEAGISFPTWAADAVPAHVGRLLAYAALPGHGTPAQEDLILRGLAVRPLPAVYRGCAPTLAGLVGTWAYPGKTTVNGKVVTYAEQVAAKANVILRG